MIRRLLWVLACLTASAHADTFTVLFAGQSNALFISTPGYQGPGGDGRGYGVEALVSRTAELSPTTQFQYVQCSVGNTSIAQWAPGGALMNTCESRAAGKTIDLVFFYQGERDAYNLENTVDYVTPCLLTLNHLKATFPSARIVYAQLATTTEPAYEEHWDYIKAQQALCQTADFTMIVTEGYPLYPGDTLHLSSPSYYEIGTVLANMHFRYSPLPDRRGSARFGGWR